MGAIFLHVKEPVFCFYLNYKVLYSSVALTLGNSEIAEELYCIHGRGKEIPKAARRRYQNGILRIKLHADSSWIDIPPDQCEGLAIVRNPYARLVSCFTHWCRRSPPERLVRTERILDKLQASLLAALDYEIVEPGVDHTGTAQSDLFQENMAQLQSLSFDRFVTAVEILFARHGVGREPYYGLNSHLAPQGRLLFWMDGYSPSFTARAEAIDSSWPELCQKMGISNSLEVCNVSGGGSVYRDYYTNALRQRVNKLYEEDLSVFDYTF